MKQKGSVPTILIILIAFLIGAGGMYYYTQQTTPVNQTPIIQPLPTSTAEQSNWNTYENTKYGYSIQYPTEKDGSYAYTCTEFKTQDPNVKKDKTLDKTAGVFILLNNSEQDPCLPSGGFVNFPVAISVGEGIPISMDSFKGYPETEMVKEKVNYGQTDGFKLSYKKIKPAPYADAWTEIWLFKNNKRYKFVFTNQFSETLPNKMLSTLKFTP